MKQLDGEGFTVEYDSDDGRVALKGTMRLGGMSEYAPVVEILHEAMEQHSAMELDLAKLEFLNSSGIATLSKFIIAVRDSGNTQLTVTGSESIPWQGKSLNNLQRLMPALELQFN